MSGLDLQEGFIILTAIIAGLISLGTWQAFVSGQITAAEALKPWWTDLAIAYPLLFVGALIGGTLVGGRVFLDIVEAM